MGFITIKPPFGRICFAFFKHRRCKSKFHVAIDATSSTSNPKMWRRCDGETPGETPKVVTFVWGLVRLKIRQFPSWCIWVLPKATMLHDPQSSYCITFCTWRIMNYEPLITRRHDKWSYTCIVIRGSSTAVGTRITFLFCLNKPSGPRQTSLCITFFNGEPSPSATDLVKFFASRSPAHIA